MPRTRAPLRRARVAGVLAALGFSSALAQAQWGASLGVESDYRYRGVSLSNARPSVQASFNVDTASGWYGGASAAQIESVLGERYLRMLAYAGYVTAAVDGRSLDVGASWSHFTGDRRYDFAEPYVGMHFGSWGLRLHYAPDYFGRHVQTAYIDASAQPWLSDRMRLFGHVGLLLPLAGRRVGDDAANRARADLRVGAGWVRDGWDLRLAWVAAGSGGPYPALYGGHRSAWVFGASYSF